MAPLDNPKEVVTKEEVKEDLDNQVLIYPNPTKGRVTIDINKDLVSKIKSIRVFDVNSSLVQDLKFNSKNETLEVNLTNQPIGVYFVHIHIENHESITKKIIKQ